MKFCRTPVILALCLSLLFSVTKVFAAVSDELIPITRATRSEVKYILYPQRKFKFDFLVKRPNAKNSDILLCIPSAFTTHANQVDGVFVSQGVAGNRSAVNANLGGAAIIQNGQIELISTNKGALLTKALLSKVEKSKGSLFQQFLLVDNGKAASFKDKSKFQRRAIYQTSDGFGVIESDRPVDFSTFNADLVELGVKNALYCDMGAWDEGWYRPNLNSKTRVIGLDKSQTARQSNWLVLRVSSAEKKAQQSPSGARRKSLNNTSKVQGPSKHIHRPNQ